VLLNLLSNAIKYNQPGGTITLGCDQSSSDWVRIEVSDTGIGIAEADFGKVFCRSNGWARKRAPLMARVSA